MWLDRQLKEATSVQWSHPTLSSYDDRSKVGCCAVLASNGRPQLVAARKMQDGSIRYGKPGEIHADLFQPGEKSYGFNDMKLGFALPGGRFLTREQALDAVKRGTPDVAAKFSPPQRHGENYLDAVQYGRAIGNLKID
jgi:hypothetical protein